MFTNISFILASSSDSRFKILKQNGLNFKKTKPACDEDLIFRKLEKLKKTPTQIVKQLAKEKAKSINSKHPKKLTVGCDTIILFNNNIVKKAKNLTAAKQKILKLSGRKHYIISAISVYKNKKEIWGFVQKTKVEIRKMTTKEIHSYLKLCENDVLESVGCYQIEKLGPRIIKRIDGDFFNVMGFPLFPFLDFLNTFNKKTT